MTVLDDVGDVLIEGFALASVWGDVGSPDPHDFLRDYKRTTVEIARQRITTTGGRVQLLANGHDTQSVNLQPILAALLILADAIDAL